MFRGKTHAALDLLTSKGRGGVLHIDHVVKYDGSDDLTVKDILKSKHPEGQPVTTDFVIQGTPP